MKNQKKIEKRLNVRINESQRKALLKREDINRMDIEFVSVPKEEHDKEEKFDIKVKSNDKFSLILIIKFFSKILNFTIKRDKKKEKENENEDLIVIDEGEPKEDKE
ncbi:hypothetical protein [Staphylococcus phage vB_StaM_SA1]|nr:hypothetical protein [Staphylococcus phage vB_StaM_SA1]